MMLVSILLEKLSGVVCKPLICLFWQPLEKGTFPVDSIIPKVTPI